MTRIELKSERKKKAIMKLVEIGEYSIPYAMIQAEKLNDDGLLLDNDYDELAEYLESLLEPVEEIIEEEQETEPVLSSSAEETTEEINETTTEVVESEEE